MSIINKFMTDISIDKKMHFFRTRGGDTVTLIMPETTVEKRVEVTLPDKSGQLVTQEDILSSSISGSYFSVTTINGVLPNSNNIELVGSVNGGNGIEIVPLPNGQIRIQLYENLNISINSGGGQYEKGQIINGNTISWTVNKVPTLQTLNGINVPVGTTSYYDSNTINSNKTYSISVSDGTTTATKSVSMTFVNKMHIGTVPSQVVTSADILSLSNNWLTDTKNSSFTIDGNGKYIVICYPQSFGNAVFTVGGLLNTAWTQTVVSHTNSYGYTENYIVYVSNTIQYGDDINIVIS
jgi:hypothetical protein